MIQANPTAEIVKAASRISSNVPPCSESSKDLNVLSKQSGGSTMLEAQT
jgi:hypothetical protein